MRMNQFQEFEPTLANIFKREDEKAECRKDISGDGYCGTYSTGDMARHKNEMRLLREKELQEAVDKRKVEVSEIK